MNDPGAMNDPVEYLGYQICIETAERRMSSLQSVWSASFQCYKDGARAHRLVQACAGQKTRGAAQAKALRFAKIAIDAQIEARRPVRAPHVPRPKRKGSLARVTRDLIGEQRPLPGAPEA